MSAAEVRDRLGDRFRLLTGPELRAGPPGDAAARGGLVLRPAGRRRARAAADRVGVRGRVRPAGPVRRRRDERRHRGAAARSTRWCASRWSSPTTAPHGPGTACSRRSARSPTSGWPRPPSARRSATGTRPTSRARPPALGAVERPRVARPGRLGAGRAGQPAVGVPLEPRSRPGRGGDRRRRARGADGVLGRAVRDHRLGGGAARGGDPGRRTTAPAAVRRGGLCLLRRAGRGRDRERPPGRPSWSADPGYESCEPGYATFIEALGQVYCGNLDRYVELTRERRGAAGQRPGLRDRGVRRRPAVGGPGRGGAGAHRGGRWRRRASSATRTGSPTRCGSSGWPCRRSTRSARWRRGTRAWRYLDEHDVRFFEGFLARDAALLHTSDGQLETALTLFDTSIGAFLRSGAVAQLVDHPGQPARPVRAARPARRRAAPCSAPWPRHPASLHHVPVAARPRRAAPRPARRRAGRPVRRQRRGDGPARRRGVRPPPDRPRPRAPSTAPASTAVRTGLTARETQVLRLIAEGATTREISERLFISAKTADNHIQHIYTKLGVTNRAAATRWALDHGSSSGPRSRPG